MNPIDAWLPLTGAFCSIWIVLVGLSVAVSMLRGVGNGSV